MRSLIFSVSSRVFCVMDSTLPTMACRARDCCSTIWKRETIMPSLAAPLLEKLGN